MKKLIIIFTVFFIISCGANKHPDICVNGIEYYYDNGVYREAFMFTYNDNKIELHCVNVESSR